MDVNPFTWLAARSRFERVLAWLLTIVLAGFWFWIWYKIARDNRDGLIAMCLITPPILSFIFCCLASIDSAREFEQQRLSGSLEFLLSCTPLTVPEILRGQWLALRRKWFGPVMVVLASDLALTVALARHHDSMSEEDFPMAVMFILAVTALLPIQLICTAWVGMLQGIRSKKLGQSRISGFVLTMIFPTLAWATMLVLASLFNAYVFVIFHPGFWLLFGSWIVISVGLQLALATHARRCLLADFRIMANPLIDNTFRFWRWLGRTLAEQIYGKPARRSPTVFD